MSEENVTDVTDVTDEVVSRKAAKAAKGKTGESHTKARRHEGGNGTRLTDGANEKKRLPGDMLPSFFLAQ